MPPDAVAVHRMTVAVVVMTGVLGMTVAVVVMPGVVGMTVAVVVMTGMLGMTGVLGTPVVVFPRVVAIAVLVFPVAVMPCTRAGQTG